MSFTGTLSELALCDLVEITTLGAKTGVLDVVHADGAPAGRLAFRDGALVSATCGALIGARGFYALLALDEGSFVFDPECDPGESADGALPTGSLLMEAMRRVDEIDHLRHALPAAAGVVALAGGDAHDDVETAVLDCLAPGSLPVSKVVVTVVADGRADDYDVLQALARLRERGAVDLLA